MNVLCGGAFLISRDLRIEWVGSVSDRWSGGKDASALAGKHCYSVIMNKRKPCGNCPVLRSYESGRDEHLEIKIDKKGNGTEYTC